MKEEAKNVDIDIVQLVVRQFSQSKKLQGGVKKLSTFSNMISVVVPDYFSVVDRGQVKSAH